MTRPSPLAPRTPARIREIIEYSLGDGIDGAFNRLVYIPRDKRDSRVDVLCDAYWQVPDKRRKNCNLEALCAEHDVEPWEFLGWVVMASALLGGNAALLAINSSKAPIVQASLGRAVLDENAARPWLQSWGYQPSPRAAQVINVSAVASSQSIAAASAQERGLPSFVETAEEAEEALRALPPAAASPTDVPFTLIEKEPIHAGPDNR